MWDDPKSVKLYKRQSFSYVPLLKTSGFLVNTAGKMHVTSSSLSNKITYLLCCSKSARKKCMLPCLHIPCITLSLGLISSRQHSTQNQINCSALKWRTRNRPMVWKTQTKVTMKGGLGSVVGLVNAHNDSKLLTGYQYGSKCSIMWSIGFKLSVPEIIVYVANELWRTTNIFTTP